MAANEQYVVDAEGRKLAVLLSLEQYEKLMEDLHDLAVVTERRDEETISLPELRQRLKKRWPPLRLSQNLRLRRIYARFPNQQSFAS